MNCLTDKQLQELIDGESSSHQHLFEHHLSECQQCYNRYNEQKKWAELVKGRVLKATPTITRVPDFNAPTISANRKLYRIPLWAKVAAVMIPAICFWRMSDKPEEAQFTPTPENLLMYEMATNSDANRSFQDKMIITTVTNEKGEVIECSTN